MLGLLSPPTHHYHGGDARALSGLLAHAAAILGSGRHFGWPAHHKRAAHYALNLDPRYNGGAVAGFTAIFPLPVLKRKNGEDAAAAGADGLLLREGSASKNEMTMVRVLVCMTLPAKYFDIAFIEGKLRELRDRITMVPVQQLRGAASLACAPLVPNALKQPTNIGCSILLRDALLPRRFRKTAYSALPQGVIGAGVPSFPGPAETFGGTVSRGGFPARFGRKDGAAASAFPGCFIGLLARRWFQFRLAFMRTENMLRLHIRNASPKLDATRCATKYTNSGLGFHCLIGGSLSW